MDTIPQNIKIIYLFNVFFTLQCIKHEESCGVEPIIKESKRLEKKEIHTTVSNRVN